MVLERSARGLARLSSGSKETTKNNRAGAKCQLGPDRTLKWRSPLDVVVEHLVLALVSLKEVESGLGVEVLVLDDHLGERLVCGSHELVHEVGGLGQGSSRASEANVERVVSDRLGVGAHATS